MIRVAVGSASVLGLANIRMDARPTTAHLMTPGKCVYNCGFCTQAAGSFADQKLLSRISWPQYEEEQVFSALHSEQDKFNRVCLQVVHSDGKENYLEHVRKIRKTCSLPLSVDVKAEDIDSVRRTFEAGADVVGLPLDVADPELYSEIKNGSYDEQLNLIKRAAGEFEGRISTHLIIGLGETERQAAELIEDMHAFDISVALFAFTPVRGTKLAQREPPELGQYRRVQLARFLVYEGHNPTFIYNEKGLISGFGYMVDELMEIMRPHAFQTSGCMDCNRPYYNERPGGVMYNYPYLPSSDEYKKAVNEALSILEGYNG
jgi:biotin synthase